MALYRPADCLLDSKGPLSRTIHPAVLNKRVKLVDRWGWRLLWSLDLYLASWYQAAPRRVPLDTKIKTTKFNSEGLLRLFTKFSTPENYPLYGM